MEAVGVANLTNEELLALVLGSGTHGFSAVQLASLVLKAFPLKELHTLPIEKLTALSGIGSAQATKILAGIELGRRNAFPPSEKIITPATVLPHVSHIRQKTKEHTLCLYLNARAELLHVETIAVGGINYNLLEIRDVVAPALTLPAVSCILVHNHPSGTLEPSSADLLTTTKIQGACEFFGVHFLDHLIVTKKAYFSFKEAGLLENSPETIFSSPSDQPQNHPSR